MKTKTDKTVISVLVALTLFSTLPLWSQDVNCTLLGRWAGGGCRDVLADGSIVYVGYGAYVQIMDFTDPVNPVLIGSITLPSEVRGLALDHETLYVADNRGSLRVVDVADPSTPTEIGALEDIEAFDVEIEGHYAYVSGANDGMFILDITHPSSPSLTGVFDVSNQTQSVAIQEPYAFVCMGKTLRVVDISSPAEPAEIANMDFADYLKEITISGNEAYVAAGSDGLRIIDISNPADPVETGLCLKNKKVEAVQVVNGIAYIAAYQTGLYIYDVSTPSNPAALDSLKNMKYMHRMSIHDGLLYGARLSNGLSVFDISSDAAPAEIYNFRTGAYWNGLDVQGHYAYLCGGEDIRIIDCTDLANPFSVSQLDATNQDSENLVIRDENAYAASSGMGVQIIDISSPENPLILSHANHFTWSRDIELSGDYAYIADSEGGLGIVDISNPEVPTEVGRYNTKGVAVGVALQDHYAFIADQDSGLTIVDVADVTNPVFVFHIKQDEYTMDCCARDHYLYQANGYNIRILDISDIHNPVETGSLDASGFAQKIQVSGDYAFTAGTLEGVVIYDISDPQIPIEAGSYQTGYDVVDIQVRDEIIYALDNLVGLYIIRFDQPDHVDSRYPDAGAAGYSLRQNYPNPFNPSTNIIYHLPRASQVKIKIYNLSGEEVTTLVDGTMEEGTHTAVWNAAEYSSGVYFYRLISGTHTETRKILLMR